MIVLCIWSLTRLTNMLTLKRKEEVTLSFSLQQERGNPRMCVFFSVQIRENSLCKVVKRKSALAINGCVQSFIKAFVKPTDNVDLAEREEVHLTCLNARRKQHTSQMILFTAAPDKLFEQGSYFHQKYETFPHSFGDM